MWNNTAIESADNRNLCIYCKRETENAISCNNCYRELSDDDLSENEVGEVEEEEF